MNGQVQQAFGNQSLAKTKANLAMNGLFGRCVALPDTALGQIEVVVAYATLLCCEAVFFASFLFLLVYKKLKCSKTPVSIGNATT